MKTSDEGLKSASILGLRHFGWSPTEPVCESASGGGSTPFRFDSRPHNLI